MEKVYCCNSVIYKYILSALLIANKWRKREMYTLAVTYSRRVTYRSFDRMNLLVFSSP